MKDVFDPTSVDTALERGIERLLAQNQGGRWRGFPTLAGESDVWVTGFILAHISGLARRRRKVRDAQAFLLNASRQSGGWSYGGEVPPDADSTAWCLMALSGVKGMSDSRRRTNESFLWSHLTNGGVATYKLDSGISKYIQAAPNHSIAGWTSAHPDVTAAAILADPHGERVEEFLAGLIARQTGAGFFNSYWWRGPHYTTTLTLRALRRCKRHLPAASARLILRALVREQLPDGGFGLGASMRLDSLTTALALESFTHLSYLGGLRNRRAAGNALLQTQGSDGRWGGDFVMRIPAPDVIDPQHVNLWKREGGGGNCYIPDRDGLFATAIACFALDCWRQAEISDGEINDSIIMHPQKDIRKDEALEIQVGVI